MYIVSYLTKPTCKMIDSYYFYKLLSDPISSQYETIQEVELKWLMSSSEC